MNDSVPPFGEVDEVPAEPDEPGLPPLHQRVVQVFFSPDKLTDSLAARPVWVGALLLAIVLVVVQTSAIPVDVLLEQQREAIMERGGDPAQISERAVSIMRLVSPIATVIFTTLFTALFAGIYTFIFVFILGDEGRYKQYLAMTAHAMIIPMFVGLLLTPLRIMTRDPQLSLNLGLFMGFLGDGYLQNVGRMLDLSQIWSTLVIARGAQAIDARRSFGSAAITLLILLVLFAMVFAFLLRGFL